MRVGEVEEHRPVLGVHGVLAGADVVAELAADEHAVGGQGGGIESTRVQESLNGFSGLEDVELPGRICPLVFLGVRE